MPIIQVLIIYEYEENNCIFITYLSHSKNKH
jgi:hypothetical protein